MDTQDKAFDDFFQSHHVNEQIEHLLQIQDEHERSTTPGAPTVAALREIYHADEALLARARTRLFRARETSQPSGNEQATVVPYHFQREKTMPDIHVLPETEGSLASTPFTRRPPRSQRARRAIWSALGLVAALLLVLINLLLWGPFAQHLKSGQSIQHPPVEIGSNTATLSCSLIDTQTNVNSNSNGAAFRDSLAASWSSQGKIALSHWLVSIYNGSTCKHVSTLPSNYTANVLSWSPDGSKLLANNFVLDATNGKQLAVFISPSVSQSTKTSEVTPLVDLSSSLVVVAAAWSPDGSRIVMAQKRTGSLAVSMYVWDAETGKTLVTLNQAQAPDFQLASSLVWSPDGSTISAASGTSVYVWNSQTGALKHTYKHVADNWSAAISPDGKYVAAGINQLQTQGLSTDPALKIYELATGKVVATYTTQEADTLTSMAWSSDSQQLAVGNARGAVLVWNASTHTLSNPYTNGEEDVARSIAWSPNNRQFVIVHDGWDPSQISLDVWTFAAH